MSEIRLPDFYIVGAAKAATTSIYHGLNKNNKCFEFRGNIKEPHYHINEVYKKIGEESPNYGSFRKKYVGTKQEYLELYKYIPRSKLTCDASVGYLTSSKETIKSIKNLHVGVSSNPAIIICLRNPFERAYSAYKHMLQSGYETLNFREALLSYNDRNLKGWHPFFDYLGGGLYYQHVKNYMEAFDRVKIILYDDIEDSFSDQLTQISRFLGIDGSFVYSSSVKMNATGSIRFKWLWKISGFRFRKGSIWKRVVDYFLSSEKKSALIHWIRSLSLDSRSNEQITFPQEVKILYNRDIENLARLLKRNDILNWKVSEE